MGRPKGAVRLDWVITRGDDAPFTVVLQEDGVPEESELTGATARLQVRAAIDDATTLLALTSGSGQIVITPAAGRIAATVPKAVSTTLDFDEAYYDLEVTKASGAVETVCQGKVFLDRDATV